MSNIDNMTIQNRIQRLCNPESGEEINITLFLAIILFGGGLYGATVGLWRSPLQAFYVAVKFPLLIFLTTLGTGLINPMLAQLMGAGITFRKSFFVVVRSYALLTIILVSFVPLILFLLYNLPPMGSTQARSAHSILLLANVALISFGGIIANINLFKSLYKVCETPGQALRILFSWLGTNMFLGCQLSWNLRPFFGTPTLAVNFLRDKPFENSFYEAVFFTFLSIFN